MRHCALFGLALVMGCISEVKLTMPYCPVSDSAKTKADSIPVGCVLDSLPR